MQLNPARILAESNRPYVVVSGDEPTWVGIVNGRWTVTFNLLNYGSSIAILETGERRPKLLFARDGDHVAFGKANTVVMPRGGGVTLSFSIDPNDVARSRGGPVMRADGSYIAASLDFWFTDGAKNTHYMVHAEFDAEASPTESFVTLLRLTNVEFGPPTVFGTAQVTFQMDVSAVGEVSRDWTFNSSG